MTGGALRLLGVIVSTCLKVEMIPRSSTAAPSTSNTALCLSDSSWVTNSLGSICIESLNDFSDLSRLSTYPAKSCKGAWRCGYSDPSATLSWSTVLAAESCVVFVAGDAKNLRLTRKCQSGWFLSATSSRCLPPRCSMESGRQASK